MWTVFILFSLGALHCTVSSSPPSPTNVIFSSVNLRNMLQWFPGNGTPGDTQFTVQYAIYGDSVKDSKGRRVRWRAVWACTEIVRSWCDLSNETSDLEQGYYARVRAVSRRASSKWVLSPRFDPKLDTSFGPPLVSVEIGNNSAIITLKGPMRHEPNHRTPVVSMATLYPQMMYNLSMHNTRSGQMSHFTVSSSQNKYHLEYKTEYCFSAKTKFLSMPVECQPSAWQCITTPPDPLIGQLQRIVVGIVVPFVCVCILVLVGYILHHYLTGKGQKSPDILKPPSFHPLPLTFNPENISLLITVIQPSDIESCVSDLACPKRWQRIRDPPAGYTPQRSETPPVPEEPWDDVSIDYACVGVHPKINARGEAEERTRRHDGGEDGNNLRGDQQKCGSSHSYDKKEFRVEDGDSAGVYAHRAKSYLSQSSTHTCAQTLMPIHTQTDVSTLLQAHACSWVNSGPQNQTQAPLLAFQGAKELDKEKDREFPGLFINKSPQMGLFNIPLNLQTKMEGEMWEEMDGEVRVRANGKIDEGVEVPLLSAYASQNITHISTSHANQSDLLPDDYGVVRLATVDIIEKDEEEEEEGTNCIDWDPMTRKLVLPEMAIDFNREIGLDGLMQGQKGGESRVGGEEKEVNVMKGRLTLEKVFVRQGSEEITEAQRELERGGEQGWESDDVLTKWNLVISMDK
ncbi:interleukin-20 receptor subunit alpha [Symphorus nematophorus]